MISMHFCGINGCENTNRNVCLYTSFSEGLTLPCATSNEMRLNYYAKSRFLTTKHFPTMFCKRISEIYAKINIIIIIIIIIISSPEHEVLMVSYCGQWLSVVRRRASCVVRRASSVVRQHLMFTL